MSVACHCDESTKREREIRERLAKLETGRTPLKVCCFEFFKHCKNGNIFVFRFLFLDLQGPRKCRIRESPCSFSLLIAFHY